MSGYAHPLSIASEEIEVGLVGVTADPPYQYSYGRARLGLPEYIHFGHEMDGMHLLRLAAHRGLSESGTFELEHVADLAHYEHAKGSLGPIPNDGRVYPRTVTLATASAQDIALMGVAFDLADSHDVRVLCVTGG